jgi:hypothetical protein
LAARVKETKEVFSMVEYEMWSFRQPVRGADLTGFKVEATDGTIGKIDEATYDTGSSYLVVDTGPWIFGKKVMLPAGTIQTVDVDEKRVLVDRTKDDIKNAPEFDPDMYREPVYREKLGGYYEPFYRR